MDLILWRHAQAETLDESDAAIDGDRKLTPKGHKQAAKMALWLNSVLPHSCRILVSPSQRTMQTAQALGRKFKVSNELYTDTTARQILAACNWPNSREAVLVVGHQPQLGEVVSLLLPEMQNCAIRKGNVWWISQKDGEEQQPIFLKAVMTPELVVK